MKTIGQQTVDGSGVRKRVGRGLAVLTALLLAGVIVLLSNTAGAATGGTLEVRLNLAGDPLNFGLAIDGSTVTTGGDGTSSGPVAVAAGAHTVQLQPGTDVPFFHVTNWACRDNSGTGAVVAAGERRSILPLEVTVADGADVVCVADSVLQQPDLEVTVSDNGGPFAAGDVIEYTIRYANLGNVTMPSTILSVFVPLHTTADVQRSTPGFICSPASATPGANCTINLSNVAPGSGTVKFVVMVSSIPQGVTGTTFHVGCTATLPGQCQGEPGIYSSLPVPELDRDNNITNITSALGVPCAPGSFSSTGSTPCTPAAAGFFVDAAGATAPTPCSVGTFQPGSGQSSCFRAAVGFYVDVTGATAQTACPEGTSTIGLGSTSAADCLADFDGDGLPDVVDPDDDGDGVLDGDDLCDSTNLAEDQAPPRLKRNRFWSDSSGNFDGSGFTIVDTGGCSASQIIEAAGLGNGHSRFGISRSALQRWVDAV